MVGAPWSAPHTYICMLSAPDDPAPPLTKDLFYTANNGPWREPGYALEIRPKVNGARVRRHGFDVSDRHVLQENIAHQRIGPPACADSECRLFSLHSAHS